MKWLAWLAAVQFCVGAFLLAHGVWGWFATHYAVWERTGLLLYNLKPDADRLNAMMRSHKLGATFNPDALGFEAMDSSSAAERLASWLGAEDTWWTRTHVIAGPVCLVMGLGNLAAVYLARERRAPTA